MTDPIRDIVVEQDGSDHAADASDRRGGNRISPLVAVMLIGLAVGLPLLLQHHWNADRDRLTLITFDTSNDDAWSGSIEVERQVADLANAWNSGESISGPYPSLVIFEGHAEGIFRPKRPVSYRIIEAIGPVPARFHSIPASVPGPSGFFDRLLAIPSDRVDRYLLVSGETLDRAGFPTVAAAARAQQTEIDSIDHGVLGSPHGIAGAACVSVSGICLVLLVAPIRKRARSV